MLDNEEGVGEIMAEFQYDFAIIGGDLRQAYMADILAENGFSVVLYATEQPQTTKLPFANTLKEAISSAKTIIGPIPLSRDGKKIHAKEDNNNLRIKEMQKLLKKGQSLFAGCIQQNICEWGNENEIFIYDFMQDDELTLYNTIATAEGAIAEAIIRQPVNLHSSKCLVVGYGRCSKILAQGLRGLCSDVTVCARKAKARSEAQVFGCQTIDFITLTEKIGMYDFIFNTVPSVVIDEELLRLMKQDCIIIDIASAPGGVDYKAAEKLGIKAYLCLGLPGKYSPKSSAEALVQVALSHRQGHI